MAGQRTVQDVDGVTIGVTQDGQRTTGCTAGGDRLQASEIQLQVGTSTVIIGENFTLGGSHARAGSRPIT